MLRVAAQADGSAVPSFAYEAAGPDGAIGRGVIDAPGRAAAVERISALGRTPVRVVERLAGAAESVCCPDTFCCRYG
jgi:type II secretory pathway component PulF